MPLMLGVLLDTVAEKYFYFFPIKFISLHSYQQKILNNSLSNNMKKRPFCEKK
jgi:hypothetical protein